MSGSSESLEPASHSWEAGATLWNPITMDASAAGSSGAVNKQQRTRTRAHGRASCQVSGCKESLTDCKPYFKRHLVCQTHAVSPLVLIGDVEMRFCQQCAKFERVTAFDGANRSCRFRLFRRNMAKQRGSFAKQPTEDLPPRQPQPGQGDNQPQQPRLATASAAKARGRAMEVQPSPEWSGGSSHSRDVPDTQHCPDADPSSALLWGPVQGEDWQSQATAGPSPSGRSKRTKVTAVLVEEPRTLRLLSQLQESNSESRTVPVSQATSDVNESVDAEPAPLNSGLRLDLPAGLTDDKAAPALQASQPQPQLQPQPQAQPQQQAHPFPATAQAPETVTPVAVGSLRSKAPATAAAISEPVALVLPSPQLMSQTEPAGAPAAAAAPLPTQAQVQAQADPAGGAAAAGAPRIRIQAAGGFTRSLGALGGKHLGVGLGEEGVTVGTPLALQALSNRPGLSHTERIALESLLGLTPGPAALPVMAGSASLELQLQDILEEVMRNSGGDVGWFRGGGVQGDVSGGAAATNSAAVAAAAGPAANDGTSAIAAACQYLGLPSGASGGVWGANPTAANGAPHCCLGPPPDIFDLGSDGAASGSGVLGKLRGVLGPGPVPRAGGVGSMQWPSCTPPAAPFAQQLRLTQQPSLPQQLQQLQLQQHHQQRQAHLHPQQQQQQQQQLLLWQQQQQTSAGAGGMGAGSDPQLPHAANTMLAAAGAGSGIRQSCGVPSAAAATPYTTAAAAAAQGWPAAGWSDVMRVSYNGGGLFGVGESLLSVPGFTQSSSTGMKPLSGAASLLAGGIKDEPLSQQQQPQLPWDDYCGKYESVRLSYKLKDCDPYGLDPSTHMLLGQIAADGSRGVATGVTAAMRPGCVRFVSHATVLAAADGQPQFGTHSEAVRSAVRQLAVANETDVLMQAGNDPPIAVDKTGAELPAAAAAAGGSSTAPVLNRASVAAVHMGARGALQLYGSGFLAPNLEFWARMQGVHYQLPVIFNGSDSYVLVQLPSLSNCGLVVLEASAGPDTALLSDWLALLVVPSERVAAEVNSLLGRLPPASLRRLIVDFGSVLDVRPLLSQPVNGLCPVVPANQTAGGSSGGSKTTWQSSIEQEAGGYEGQCGGAGGDDDEAESTAGATEAGVLDVMSFSGTASTLTSIQGTLSMHSNITGVSNATAPSSAFSNMGSCSITGASVIAARGVAASDRSGASGAAAAGSCAEGSSTAPSRVGLRSDFCAADLSAHLLAAGAIPPGGSPATAARVGRLHSVQRLLGCFDASELLTNADDETVVERLLSEEAVTQLLSRAVSVITFFTQRCMVEAALCAVAAVAELYRSFPDLLRAELAPQVAPGSPCLMHAAVRARSLSLLLALAKCGEVLGDNVSMAWRGPGGITPLHLVALLGQPYMVTGVQLAVPAVREMWGSLHDDNGITPAEIWRGSGGGVPADSRHHMDGGSGAGGSAPPHPPRALGGFRRIVPLGLESVPSEAHGLVLQRTVAACGKSGDAAAAPAAAMPAAGVAVVADGGALDADADVTDVGAPAAADVSCVGQVLAGAVAWLGQSGKEPQPGDGRFQEAGPEAADLIAAASAMPAAETAAGTCEEPAHRASGADCEDALARAGEAEADDGEANAAVAEAAEGGSGVDDGYESDGPGAYVDAAAAADSDIGDLEGHTFAAASSGAGPELAATAATAAEEMNDREPVKPMPGPSSTAAGPLAALSYGTAAGLPAASFRVELALTLLVMVAALAVGLGLRVYWSTA